MRLIFSFLFIVSFGSVVSSLDFGESANDPGTVYFCETLENVSLTHVNGLSRFVPVRFKFAVKYNYENEEGYIKFGESYPHASGEELMFGITSYNFATDGFVSNLIEDRGIFIFQGVTPEFTGTFVAGSSVLSFTANCDKF